MIVCKLRFFFPNISQQVQINQYTLIELCAILYLIPTAPSSGFSYRNSATRGKGKNSDFFPSYFSRHVSVYRKSISQAGISFVL